MPMLLEDLAEETSASNRRVADRLDAEARELHKLERELEELQHRAVESARQATEYALSRVPQAEGVWRSALVTLRKNPTGADAERLLHTLLGVFESGLRIVRGALTLWAVSTQFKAASEQIDELSRAEGRFEEMAAEAKLALEHRTRDWQPADPERLALGLQLAREGKTVKADEARARFRRAPG